MVNKITAILHLVSFFVCLYGFGMFFWWAVQVIGEVQPKKRQVANFIPILVLFRSSYTPKGQQLYDHAAKGLFVSACGGIVLLGTMLL